MSLSSSRSLSISQYFSILSYSEIWVIELDSSANAVIRYCAKSVCPCLLYSLVVYLLLLLVIAVAQPILSALGFCFVKSSCFIFGSKFLSKLSSNANSAPSQ